MLKRNSYISFVNIGLIIFFNLFYRYTYIEDENDKLREIKSITKPVVNNDYSFLSEKLHNKRIIVLGEQLHEDGSTFFVKEQIIRYLHENESYDIVLYEAGLYDMWQMNEDSDTLNPSMGLYNFWWKNEETKNLWQYYEKEKKTNNNPIYLGGFDVQLTGNIPDSVRISKLKDYLYNHDILLDDYPHFSSLNGKINRYLTYWKYNQDALSREQRDSILMDINQITDKIKDISNPKIEDKIYYRYLSGLSQWFETVWKYPEPGTKERFQIRDSLMADNLIWLIDSIYPNKKVIVWMANLHAVHPKNPIENIPMRTTGQYLQEHYQDSLYTVVFSSYARLNKNNHLSNKLSNKSVEYLIHKLDIPFGFIDLRNIDSTFFLTKNFISGINQGISIDANWAESADLFFYIDTMQRITPLK
jgi:erythromycin esterase-like protein